MKKFFTFVIAVLGCAFNSFAQDADGLVYYQNLIYHVTDADNNYVELYGKLAAHPGGDVVIPSTFTADQKNWTVTAINQLAASADETITSVFVPATVKALNNNYHGLSQLKKCKTITFEQGSQLSTIADGSFQNDYILESLIVPKGVKTIEDYTFQDCRGLRTLSFEEGSELTTIKRAADNNGLHVLDLSNCTKLTSIATAAFKKSSNGGITDLYLPGSLKTFGVSCFADQSTIKTIVIDNTSWTGYTFGATVFRSLTGATLYYNAETSADDIPQTIKDACSTCVAVDPIKVTEAGYATYYNGEQSIKFPASVEASVVAEVEKNQLTLDTYNTYAAIPAGTGLVIKAVPGVHVPAYTTGGEAKNSNLLKGSDTAITTTGADLYYKLSLNNDEEAGSVGFYWGAEGGNAFTSEAHKAYLALTVAQASNVRAFRFDGTFDNDGTTAINAVSAATNGVMYNIQGQRVNANHKGLVILNGKKIIK